MTLHLYTITRNEEDLLGFFFRHYDPIVDRYVVFDNGSTDRTREILSEHPRVDLRSFPWSDPDSFVLSHTRLQNEVWKESRGLARWVIITAIDEHLHVPGHDLADRLARWRDEDVTIVPALGFDMYSDDFPEPHETLVESRTRGIGNHRMCKLSLFDPDAVVETGYWPGRHFCLPEGRLRLPRRDELCMFHYKMLDSERAYRRNRFLHDSLASGDRAHRFGRHYARSHEDHVALGDTMRAHALEIGGKGIDPLAFHRWNRWWRWHWKLRNRLGLVGPP